MSESEPAVIKYPDLFAILKANPRIPSGRALILFSKSDLGKQNVFYNLCNRYEYQHLLTKEKSGRQVLLSISQPPEIPTLAALPKQDLTPPVSLGTREKIKVLTVETRFNPIFEQRQNSIIAILAATATGTALLSLLF